MVLNYIWVGFFIVAFIVACIKYLAFNEVQIFSEIMNSTFSNAELGFELALFLTGVMALWMGIMKIGERGGMVQILGRITAPFFRQLFPEIPKNHPVFGSMLMNFSANMLGLDNAATPLGLKAMDELQSLNPSEDTASNAQIMFLVLNTSGLTLIPVSVMAVLAERGFENPAIVFLPILLATFFSSLVGLIAVATLQRINLLKPVVLAYLFGLGGVIALLFWLLGSLPPEQLQHASSGAANFILLTIIVSFIGVAAFKKVNVYEAFVDGAKEGFGVAIKIIPYLVAMLVAIGVFRACGALDFLIDGVGWFCTQINVDPEWAKSLPTAVMKPLSGSGARGAMVETIDHYGVSSFPAFLSAVMQGSTETTFYVLAVYFGAVNIRKTRYAVACGLLADLAGIIAAILISYWLFQPA